MSEHIGDNKANGNEDNPWESFADGVTEAGGGFIGHSGGSIAPFDPSRDRIKLPQSDTESTSPGKNESISEPTTDDTDQSIDEDINYSSISELHPLNTTDVHNSSSELASKDIEKHDAQFRINREVSKLESPHLKFFKSGYAEADNVQQRFLDSGFNFAGAGFDAFSETPIEIFGGPIVKDEPERGSEGYEKIMNDMYLAGNTIGKGFNAVLESSGSRAEIHFRKIVALMDDGMMVAVTPEPWSALYDPLPEPIADPTAHGVLMYGELTHIKGKESLGIPGKSYTGFEENGHQLSAEDINNIKREHAKLKAAKLLGKS